MGSKSNDKSLGDRREDGDRRPRKAEGASGAKSPEKLEAAGKSSPRPVGETPAPGLGQNTSLLFQASGLWGLFRQGPETNTNVGTDLNLDSDEATLHRHGRGHSCRQAAAGCVDTDVDV